MTNKLIVLSMDAMVTEDLEYLRNKPNFKKLFAEAAWSPAMRQYITGLPGVASPRTVLYLFMTAFFFILRAA